MGGQWWLIPGTLCTAEVFAPLLAELGVSNGDCRVVRLDRPAVEDYTAELAAIRPEDVVLGFSLGAILAAHHLDHIRARTVVLLAANPFPDVPEKRAARLAMLEQARQRGAAAALAEGLSSQLGAGAADRPEIWQRILAMAEGGEAVLEAQTQLALSRPGATPMIAAAQGRVLFLSGSADPAAPPDRAASAAALGGHRFELVEGAGHYLPLEAPGACARHIADFLGTGGASPC
ncbi:alpha/beta hydrolase [Paracoccus sp. pheM1]|uniref:alpha/beta fold hydrolase n=1 Tax=Paracoccus sp. pheM1 TaxID=2831675 RepID=UPI001BDB7F7A|nr:alpha/beta hydrolase [Paracoccus sp. pheM1]MBT0781443.1 alpha/beta hydrolase [Paracoccus sp. pheM1]